jgi:hypothetical protein
MKVAVFLGGCVQLEPLTLEFSWDCLRVLFWKQWHVAQIFRYA